MAQFRISPALVREELMKIMNVCAWWEFEDKDAEKLLTYTAGALDMANAIIRRYEGGSEE
jgi:hypothetical protein